MTERILTLHPDEGKQGVNIERVKYDQIRSYILDVFDEVDEIANKDFIARAQSELAGRFDGKIGWYYMTVKLDLEARGIIERIPNRKPQMLRLIGKNS